MNEVRSRLFPCLTDELIAILCRESKLPKNHPVKIEVEITDLSSVMGPITLNPIDDIKLIDANVRPSNFYFNTPISSFKIIKPNGDNKDG